MSSSNGTIWGPRIFTSRQFFKGHPQCKLTLLSSRGLIGEWEGCSPTLIVSRAFQGSSVTRKEQGDAASAGIASSSASAFCLWQQESGLGSVSQLMLNFRQSPVHLHACRALQSEPELDKLSGLKQNSLGHARRSWWGLPSLPEAQRPLLRLHLFGPRKSGPVASQHVVSSRASSRCAGSKTTHDVQISKRSPCLGREDCRIFMLKRSSSVPAAPSTHVKGAIPQISLATEALQDQQASVLLAPATDQRFMAEFTDLCPLADITCPSERHGG